jgi:oligopeptide transport system permease protein
MSEAATTLRRAPLPAGRSLFQLAILRFRRNQAAMCTSVVLALIVVFCFLGPFVIPHRYDQVFSSYVAVPPSFQARPDVATLQDVAESIARQARVTLQDFSIGGNAFSATDQRPNGCRPALDPLFRPDRPICRYPHRRHLGRWQGSEAGRSLEPGIFPVRHRH